MAAARVYTQLLEAHPYVTLAIINGTLSTIGDCCAQIITGGGKTPWDAVRTLRFLAFGAGIGPLAGMWNRYLEENYPLRVTVLSPAFNPVPLEEVVSATGVLPSPVVRQSFEFQSFGDSKHHRRTSSSMASDIGLVPPPAPTTAGGLKGISPFLMTKRLAVDQIFMGLMEGKGPEAIWIKNRDNLWPILLVNWRVWPIIQIVTFLYIPLNFRVPSSGVLGVLWTIYLSIQNSSSANASP